MADSSIEWCDKVWNPTTGCDQVSPGCDNCYALTMAKRLKGMGSAKYQTDGDPRTSGPGFGLAVHPDVLDQPLRWRKPARVFVNSMSDLFHPKVPDDFIHQVWDVMEWTPRHTYQVLTKRPKRLRSFLIDRQARHQAYADQFDLCPTEAMRNSPAAQDARRWASNDGFPHIWVGTSVEDQQRADERIPALLETPAAVRFLSVEPLLGPVDLTRVQLLAPDPPHGPGAWLDATRGHIIGPDDVIPELRLDWVIVGGESGPGFRPMGVEWARSLRDQCQDAGVAFFFKQHGGARPKANGRELDGRTWDEFPGVSCG